MSRQPVLLQRQASCLDARAQQKAAFVQAGQPGSCRTQLAASIAGCGAGNELEQLAEILQNSTCETPTTTYLGVSPPVRSGSWGGAANPLSHDRSWKVAAYSASHTNLQALRELDSAGESFLRGSADCGDSRLLLGSPDMTLLSDAATADADADGDWSDVGSDDEGGYGAAAVGGDLGEDEEEGEVRRGQPILRRRSSGAPVAAYAVSAAGCMPYSRMAAAAGFYRHHVA